MLKNEHFLLEENYRTHTSKEMDETNYYPLNFKEHHRSKIPLHPSSFFLEIKIKRQDGIFHVLFISCGLFSSQTKSVTFSD